MAAKLEYKCDRCGKTGPAEAVSISMSEPYENKGFCSIDCARKYLGDDEAPSVLHLQALRSQLAEAKIKIQKLEDVQAARLIAAREVRELVAAIRGEAAEQAFQTPILERLFRGRYRAAADFFRGIAE